MQSSTPTDTNAFRSLLVRAFALSSGVALVVGGLAWLLGAAPAGLESFLGLGVGAAILAGAIALWINGLVLNTRPGPGMPADGAVLAGRLQGLLAASFAVKLVVLVIGMFTLHRVGVKFDAVATFCISFAVASLICQLLSAGYVSRELGNRARTLAASRSAAGPSPGGPSPINQVPVASERQSS